MNNLNDINILNTLPPVFFPNEVDIVHELFYPVASLSDSFDCLSGYFSSKVLTELAEPLSELFSNKMAKGRFIISPNLSDEDSKALFDAYNRNESTFKYLIGNVDLVKDQFFTLTIDVMKYLIFHNRLDIRIALMKKGMMHAKIWLFNTSVGKVAIHGSGNATKSGLMTNFEQLVFSRNWESPSSATIIDSYQNRFDSFWDSRREDSYTLKLNDKTIQDIFHATKNSNFNDDLTPLINGLKKYMENIVTIDKLKIPKWLNFRDGDYKHQGEAVDAWLNNECNGIFSIATGGGKTLTSLTAASLALCGHDKALIIIAVPTKPLITQWGHDVRHFNILPLETAGVSANLIIRSLKSLKREIRVVPSHKVVILTHNAIKNNDILKVIESFDCTKMLIADEAHNLGAIGFTSNLPNFFSYRLALSATIERQYDEIGTEIIKDYFGGVVYEFSVEEAIGKCLVPFDYYTHKIYLNDSEVEKWIEISQKIRRLYGFGDTESESQADLLAIRRRAIAENAEGKILKFKQLFDSQNDKNYTLVFCTDKDKEQLISVNQVLRDSNVRFRQVTSEETKDRKLTTRIIDDFKFNELQVLTSKRVLDEGFNIPPVRVAYIISSNGVERQWLQRLGRVLRKSEDTGKMFAIIHDFIVIPPNVEQDKSLRTLINNELKRVIRFTQLSRNGSESKGSFEVIDHLTGLLE